MFRVDNYQFTEGEETQVRIQGKLPEGSLEIEHQNNKTVLNCNKMLNIYGGAEFKSK